MGVEKTIHSKMLVASSYHRIFTVGNNIGMGIGGVLADGRQLVNRSRDESSAYKRNYGIEIPGKVISQRLAAYVHAYTEYWHLRPFGVSSLMACYDEHTGPQLYMINPSGECYRYFGTAVGKGAQAAKVELEKCDFETITCEEAVVKISEMLSFLLSPSLLSFSRSKVRESLV